MLVWVASYPRSGNTLLRQVLKSCFELSACESLEPVPEQFRTPDRVRDEYYGSYFVEGDPEEFYTKALTSPELTLIKSHQLPRDTEKTIYVVRDGRLALRSYVKYQDTFHPGTSTFDSLLIGDHPYGEWTSHYHAWCRERGGSTLLIRFEELVYANAELLARIAEFIGKPVLREWVNPQAKLQKERPNFFGSGSQSWQPDEFWTPARLRAFYTIHGALLSQLGYATASEVQAGAYPAGSEEERLVLSSHALAAANRALQQTCDDRLEQVNLLKQICDERAALIDRLNSECQARDRAIAAYEAESQRLAAENAQLQSRAKPSPLSRLVRHSIFGKLFARKAS